MRRPIHAFAGLALAALFAACADTPVPTVPGAEREANLDAPTQALAGAVFTSTNGADGNYVLVFPRYADGQIGEPAMAPTGGTGSGAGDLGSQGAVTLSDDGRWLLVVNAGSDDVSVFRLSAAELTLTDRVPSGGTFPVSVAIHGDKVAVLNAGMPNNITGFRLSPDGKLMQVPGSTQPLSAEMTGPAQAAFHPNGHALVVTEKATNLITTFILGEDGVLRRSTASASPTPFGFAFDPRGRLVVSEAVGGEPGASVLSSYALSRNGRVNVITGSVATTQTAACWVVITSNGRYAYTTNTGSGSVSSFTLDNRARLSLLDPVAANTGEGSSPIDMALSRDSRFLHVLTPGTGMVQSYAVGSGGSLSELGSVDGIPGSAYGLAAY